MMPKRRNKVVHFRITTSQYERLLNLVKMKGHSTLSDYLRFTALEKDLLFEEKFNKLYKVVFEIKNKMESSDHKTSEKFINKISSKDDNIKSSYIDVD